MRLSKSSYGLNYTCYVELFNTEYILHCCSVMCGVQVAIDDSM